MSVVMYLKSVNMISYKPFVGTGEFCQIYSCGAVENKDEPIRF